MAEAPDRLERTHRPRPRRHDVPKLVAQRDCQATYDLGCDQQTRLGAAPARPRDPAPRPRPDRPGVRPAAGRRSARPRRPHVRRAPEPRVQARLRRIALQLSDDAADRARHGAAASWRPQRPDVCFTVGCSSLGTFSTRFTELVGMPPSTYRREAARATAGIPACVAKQVTRPVRNREAPASEPQLA